MSGASEAVKALQAVASDAYRATHIAGSHYARANQGVAEADDIVKALAATIDLLVAAESLHKAADEAVALLRRTLGETMNEVGASQIKGLHHTAQLARKPAFLTVENEATVPEQFWVQPPKAIDKRALKSALKDGALIEGVNLVTPNEMQLRIVSNKEQPQ
jgi:hypothetical protein